MNASIQPEPRDSASGQVPALEVRAVLPAVYDELRRLATAFLSHERPDHTLQPTALVHEAYLKLAVQANQPWRNAAHFKALAAGAMRQVLVEYARRHRSIKRGGRGQRVPLDSSIITLQHHDIDLLALDDALQQLAKLDFRQSQVVELRFFGGLSIDETAELLGVSPATVSNDWAVARAWLSREIGAHQQ